jgi:uncharacterized phage infection (PIP) family protein YhgE
VPGGTAATDATNKGIGTVGKLADKSAPVADNSLKTINNGLDTANNGLKTTNDGLKLVDRGLDMAGKAADGFFGKPGPKTDPKVTAPQKP